MPRALLIKFGAIGDAVMLLPAAHQLHLAGYEIDWVCGPAILPILQMYSWIDPILADDRALLTGSRPGKLAALLKLWRTLAGRRYDLAATLYYDRRYRLLTLPVRARRKIMLSRTDRRFQLLPGRHHTDEFARILLDRPDIVNPIPLAPIPPDTLPPSPLPPPTRPRIVLAPGGARNLLADDALRRWPPESYAALAQLLLAEGFEVILIGGPTDTWVQPFFEKLQPGFTELPMTDLIGALTLPETLALLDASSLLITHDTGPLHLAGLTRCGLIGLFGPTDPRTRLPQRPGTLALWGGDRFPCRPCYDGHTFAPCPRNDCIRQITPAHIFAETLAMLAHRAAGTLPPPRIAPIANACLNPNPGTASNSGHLHQAP